MAADFAAGGGGQLEHLRRVPGELFGHGAQQAAAGDAADGDAGA